MDQKRISCTVLGANGYIGRHLCYYLNEMGAQVFAYGQSKEAHPSLPEKISYQQFDITNQKNVESLRLDVDFLFHFSGLTGTKNSFEDYQIFTEVNEIGLLHVLNTIKDLAKKPRVIFPSSRLVYKGDSKPLKEDDPKEAKTIYAANKLNCEQFLKTYNSNYGIDYTVFRICVPYGNILDSSFSFGTIGFFLNRARAGQAIPLFGDGQLKRTFTPIDSLCNQIIAVIRQKASINEIYNLHGETMSLLGAAKPIAKKFNVPIDFVPWPEEDLKLESGDTIFDSTMITNVIGEIKTPIFNDWILQFEKNMIPPSS